MIPNSGTAPGGQADQTPASLLLVDLTVELANAASPAREDRLDGRAIDDARNGALKSASDAVAAVTRQATSRAEPLPARTPRPPLRILLSPDGDAPPVRLDVAAEQMDELVTYCFLIGGWPSVGRLWLALGEGIDARGSGEETKRSPELQTLGLSLTKLNAATAPTLESLASRSASVLERRLHAIAEQAFRYEFAPAPMKQPPPQSGGKGGPGGQDSGGAGGGSGSTPAAAQDGPAAYRAADGQAGNAVRELVRLVTEIGQLVQEHDRAEQQLQTVKNARDVEKEVRGKI